MSCYIFFRDTVQLSRQKSDSVISEMQFSRFTVNLSSSVIKAEDYSITRQTSDSVFAEINFSYQHIGGIQCL